MNAQSQLLVQANIHAILWCTLLFDNLLGPYDSSTDCFIIPREQGRSYHNHTLRQCVRPVHT